MGKMSLVNLVLWQTKTLGDSSNGGYVMVYGRGNVG
jgi:hypothetical protein